MGELTPGQQLRAEIRRQGITQQQLAVRMGYSASSVYRLISDRRPMTPAIDRCLHRALGTPMGHWTQIHQVFCQRMGSPNEQTLKKCHCSHS